MGSDDLFNKNRLRDLKRKQPTKDQLPKILIICEGEKTEKLYFEELIKHYRLSTAHIIVKFAGSAPITIVNAAKDEFDKEKKSDPYNKYDRVYCVFDRDDHDSFNKAIDKINSLNEKDIYKDVFVPIISVRQFEFWFLLHYTEEAKPVTDGKTLIKELKKYIPDYGKNKAGYYKILFDKYPDAKKRAEIINSNHKKDEQSNDDPYFYPNPSTNVYELTEMLINLKK